MDGRSRLVAFGAVAAFLLAVAAAPAEADIHGRSNPQGALAGKKVVISPGHGCSGNPGSVSWQRGTTPSTVPDAQRVREDIHNNEFVIEHLSRMLVNAGATVFTCRERSYQRIEYIVDDAGPGYSEVGTWNASTQATNYYGNGYRTHSVSPSETASATFSVAITYSGAYPVYVWYTPGTNRCADAKYRVAHGGGVTEVTVNQQAYRAGWFFIGEFTFEAGTAARVTLSNQGSSPSQYVIADAVRIGGGIGTTGEPRWHEQALLYTAYAGFTSAASWNDVTVRPAYACWLAGNPANPDYTWRFISIHTNASGGSGTAQGCDAFSYSNGRTPAWDTPGPVMYGTALQSASDGYCSRVLDQVRTDMASYDPNFQVHSTLLMNFGELRECTAMPSFLIELAFHDNTTDVLTYIRKERWRNRMMRALFKGIVKDFNPTATIAPLPPDGVWIQNLGGGALGVGWTPRVDPLENSAAPTQYKVYLSDDGVSYDDGTVTSATSYILSGLPVGQAVFARVAQMNAGGESLPSDIVGARVGAAAPAGILLVDAFDRSFDYNYYNEDQRYRGDELVRHATALTGYPFDGSTDDALTSGALTLGTYDAVDWITGEESTEDETFSVAQQNLFVSFLGNGGRALVSGAEIGWDLDSQGTITDRAFYNGYLYADYAADDAGVYRVSGVAGTPFAGLGGLEFEDGTHGRYDVDYADCLLPVNGSSAVMTYDGTSYNAAVAYQGPTTRVISMGFPIESLVSAAARESVMTGAMGFVMAGSSGGTPPAGPSGLALGPSDTTMALSWSDNSTDETGFIIYRSNAAGTLGSVAAVTAVNATAWLDKGLARGTLYNYRVYAFNNAGSSATFAEASARTASGSAPAPQGGGGGGGGGGCRSAGERAGGGPSILPLLLLAIAIRWVRRPARKARVRG